MLASHDRRLLTLAITTLLTLIFAAAASSVEAQAWLDDRKRAEGRGIRLGNFELHPGLGAEIGYDSNVFYADQDPQDDFILRITPHLLLSTIGDERRGEGEQRGSPPAVAFRGGISASVYHFFEFSEQDNVEGDLGLDLTIAPERPFSATIHEHFTRTIRPFTEARGSLDVNFSRDRNDAGILFALSSPGEILKGTIGYSLWFDYFEGDEFNYATNLTHHIEGGASWKFYPHTAFLYDVTLDIQDYPDAGASPTTALSNNIRLRNRVGINGAFTQRLSLTAMVGYAAGFYDEFDEFESLIAQLELRWQISDTVRTALGYDRDFFPSFVGNSYRRDRGYLNLQVLLGGVFLMGAEASVALVDFGSPVDITGMPLGDPAERKDVRFEASLFGEYRVTDWLGFNATVAYVNNATDFQYRLMDPTAGLVLDPAEYQKVEVWLGVRAFL